MCGLRELKMMGSRFASGKGHGRWSCEPDHVESRNRNKLGFCVIDNRLDEMKERCLLFESLFHVLELLWRMG